MNKIIYVSYFDIHTKRNVAPSAVTKTQYIAKALSNIYDEVEIVSLASINKKSQSDCVYEIDDKIKYRLFGGKYFKNKLLKTISRYQFENKIKRYLQKNLSSGDTVVLYHSLANMKLVRFLKDKCKVKIVYEIEEIYSDVSLNSKMKEKELNNFKYGNSYIFPTELLNEKINVENKPYSICYGTYEYAKNNIQIKKWPDDKIHCVYAGTLDTRKNGAIYSIKAAEFLDENYMVHILGFGSKEEINLVREEIKRVNQIKGFDVVSFDGLLSGQDYLNFLQKCKIGLSTQNSDGEYNNTSFPSKILSYMSNGLCVVSVGIPVVEGSMLADDLFLYKENNPKEIANAIKLAGNSNIDCEKIINGLNNDFIEKLRRVL